MGGETSSDRGRVILDTHAATSQKRLGRLLCSHTKRGMREKRCSFREALMAQLLWALKCFQVLERVAGLSQVTMRDSKKIKQFVAA